MAAAAFESEAKSLWKPDGRRSEGLGFTLECRASVISAVRYMALVVRMTADSHHGRWSRAVSTDVGPVGVALPGDTVRHTGPHGSPGLLDHLCLRGRFAKGSRVLAVKSHRDLRPRCQGPVDACL